MMTACTRSCRICSKQFTLMVTDDMAHRAHTTCSYICASVQDDNPMCSWCNIRHKPHLAYCNMTNDAKSLRLKINQIAAEMRMIKKAEKPKPKKMAKLQAEKDKLTKRWEELKNEYHNPKNTPPSADAMPIPHTLSPVEIAPCDFITVP